MLGVDFAGTLVTDCYSAYDAQGAKAKQKCLSHLARTARDWQKLTAADSADYRFFEAVKEWVKRGCDFHRRREQLSEEEQADEKAWLRAELKRLQDCPLNHEKAVTLQERINRYAECWLVFLDDPRVPPTNNHAERCLRPLVILRKITFGHRTHSGATRMARLMTIQETAKRHGRRTLDVIYRLAMLAGKFPDALLRYIYAGPGMTGFIGASGAATSLARESTVGLTIQSPRSMAPLHKGRTPRSTCRCADSRAPACVRANCLWSIATCAAARSQPHRDALNGRRCTARKDPGQPTKLIPVSCVAWIYTRSSTSTPPFSTLTSPSPGQMEIIGSPSSLRENLRVTGDASYKSTTETSFSASSRKNAPSGSMFKITGLPSSLWMTNLFSLATIPFSF